MELSGRSKKHVRSEHTGVDGVQVVVGQTSGSLPVDPTRLAHLHGAGVVWSVQYALEYFPGRRQRPWRTTALVRKEGQAEP